MYICVSVGVGIYQLCECASWGYVKLSEHVWAFKSVYLCMFACASEYLLYVCARVLVQGYICYRCMYLVVCKDRYMLVYVHVCVCSRASVCAHLCM